MGKKSKDKGSRWERECCVKLSKWTGFVFERTKLSGGGNAKGDIYPAYESFCCIVECKHTQTWNHSHFFTRVGPIFNDWLPKLIEESNGANRSPLLLLKTNNKKPLVIIESNKTTNTFLKSIPDTKQINFQYNDMNLMVVLMSDFLETNGRLSIK